jgi:hypothetical protein
VSIFTVWICPQAVDLSAINAFMLSKALGACTRQFGMFQVLVLMLVPSRCILDFGFPFRVNLLKMNASSATKLNKKDSNKRKSSVLLMSTTEQSFPERVFFLLLLPDHS